MFSDFFYYLRKGGLDVSLQEWLTLCEALEKGLAHSDFTAFYDLCRAVLIKSEVEYDLFDRLFLEYFKMIEAHADDVTDEVLSWLDNPEANPNNYDEEINKIMSKLTEEKIEEMLKERLKEQTEEHDGGTYWVGTGGMSVFGNAGNAPQGIRVGGRSVHRRAFRVAGERSFRDFRHDQVLDVRQFQVALRYLRQYSTRTNDPKTELNAQKSVDATCDNAGRLELIYEQPRRNTIKVLLLMDSGGSMETYSELCATLFQAVSKANRFKDLKIYYFHNCVRQYVYSHPSCDSKYQVSTKGLIQNLSRDYRVILVGDAEMNPYELMNPSFEDWSGITGIEWFHKLKKHFRHIVWLNPGDVIGGFVEAADTYRILKKEFDMYPLSIEGLTKAMKKLVASR